MGGFATYDKGGGVPGTVVFADNVDFTGTGRTNTITTNGQLLIGSTAANAGGNHINVGRITSPLGTVTIGYSSPNITLDITGGIQAVEHLTGDTGGQLNPTANNFNIIGQDGIKVNGAVSTLTITPRGAGTNNMFLGQGAGNATLTGHENVGYGAGTLANLTSGVSNTAVGYLAQNTMTTGSNNTAVGYEAQASGAGGVNNTSVGYQAQQNVILNGMQNDSFGVQSGQGLTTGFDNCSFGYTSLKFVTTGNSNSCFGHASGSHYTTGSESNNLLLGSDVFGTNGESNVIRIGNATNSTCFITGITGNTVSNPLPVFINSSTSQLGVGSATIVGTWTDVTGATQTLAVGNGYFTDRGGGVTYTLPATAALGDIIKIDGKLGLTTINQNASQSIRFGSSITTVGVGGSATGTNVGDCVSLRCSTAGASTVWIAENFVGNWTIV